MQPHTISPQAKTLLRNVLIGVAVAASLIGLAPRPEAGRPQGLAGMMAPWDAGSQPNQAPTAALRSSLRE